MRITFQYVILLLFLLVSVGGNAQEYNYPNDPLKIVVLGSSTAAGAQLMDRSRSWVGLYADHLKSFNPKNEVINLAVSGYCTYHIMPTDFVPPSRRKRCDPTANITQALALDCDGIIVNLPSNDVYFHYSTKEQLDNLKEVVKLANAKGVPIWICTTQPRSFNRHDQRDQQRLIYDSIQTCFPENHLDFWTGLGDKSNGLIENFDSGDGCHLNYDGHEILVNSLIKSAAFESQIQSSGVKVLIEVTPPKSPNAMNIAFKGDLTVDTPYLADGIKIELIQRDSVLNSQTVDSRKYELSSDADIRYPFHLRFSGKEILTKTIAFDFNSIPTQDSILAAGSSIPIHSLNLVIVPLSNLGETPVNKEICIARFAYKETNNFYLLMPDQDFIRVQRERMSYLYEPILKGRVKRYNANGKLLGKFKYKNGKLHGKCTWYHDTEQKMVQAKFENGIYNGKYVIYWENGKPREKHQYENGVLIGTAIEYDENWRKGTPDF
jgi:lysophospholipase L1-like esterase